MRRLFAMEENKEPSKNDLLIDKLLEKNKEPKSPISLTADLLKQREQVSKEVNQELKSAEEEDKDKSEDDKPSDEGDGEVEDSKGDPTENEGGEKDSEDKPKEDTNKSDSSEAKPETKDDDVNDDNVAEDKDDLKSLIGSGLSSKSDKDEDDKPVENKKSTETATESYRSPKVTLSNLFDPIKTQYKNYLFSLESYNLQDKAASVEEQPVAYVKDSVLESIRGLTGISFKYVENNTAFTKTISESVLSLNERITVLNSLVENQKYHFTHKLVSDRDIIANVSYKGSSELRETSRALLRYIEDSNTAISMMVNNDFGEMKTAFLSRDFVEEGQDLGYGKALPGFATIKVAFVPYVNYLKTKIDNFHYYKLKAVKPEDLYSLASISVTKDKDLEYIVKTLSDLLVSVTVAIDTLKGVTENFDTFTNELKVIAYNVENDQYKSIAQLGIDEKIKDFIKFKLAMEASYININMTIDYITSVLSVLDICLELSE